MDEINPEFSADDVAPDHRRERRRQPAARSDPGSPIYGMPILDVDNAKHIVVMKRSINRARRNRHPLFVDRRP